LFSGVVVGADERLEAAATDERRAARFFVRGIAAAAERGFSVARRQMGPFLVDRSNRPGRQASFSHLRPPRNSLSTHRNFENLKTKGGEKSRAPARLLLSFQAERERERGAKSKVEEEGGSFFWSVCVRGRKESEEVKARARRSRAARRRRRGGAPPFVAASRRARGLRALGGAHSNFSSFHCARALSISSQQTKS
jgi:hypothetical protein